MNSLEDTPIPLVFNGLGAHHRDMLKIDHREVVAQEALKKLKGRMTQQEISDLTGIALGTIKNFSYKRIISPPDFETLYKWLNERGLLEDLAHSSAEPSTAYGVSRVRNTVVCPSCRQETPQDFDGKLALACCHCAAQIFTECPNPKCGLANPLHADFCTRCNTPLHDDAATAEAKASNVTREALKTKTDRIRDRDKEARKKGKPTF